jgi:hypothetical protein
MACNDISQLSEALQGGLLVRFTHHTIEEESGGGGLRVWVGGGG